MWEWIHYPTQELHLLYHPIEAMLRTEFVGGSCIVLKTDVYGKNTTYCREIGHGVRHQSKVFALAK